MKTIDRVLSKARVSQDELRDALRVSYLEQIVDDDATDIYIAVWERICERTDKATARAMFSSIMESLPAEKRSDVDCDGESL